MRVIECDFNEYDAKRFVESIADSVNTQFIDSAISEFRHLKSRIDTIYDKAYKVKAEAVEGSIYCQKKIGEKKDSIKYKKNQLISTPPVVYQNTGEYDQYGNPIKRMVDNGAIRQQYIKQTFKRRIIIIV